MFLHGRQENSRIGRGSNLPIHVRWKNLEFRRMVSNGESRGYRLQTHPSISEIISKHWICLDGRDSASKRGLANEKVVHGGKTNIQNDTPHQFQNYMR